MRWEVLEKIQHFDLQKILMDQVVSLEDQALVLLLQLLQDSFLLRLEPIPEDLSDNLQVCVE